MKTCPSCGLEFADRYIFCTEDGSRLIEAAQDAAERESRQSTDANQTNPRVLYCPACAMEYPLTFTACPVDGALLKREQIVVTSTPRDEAAPNDTNGNNAANRLEPAAQEQIVQQPSLSHAHVSRDTSDLSFVESNLRPGPRKIILTPEVEDEILKRAEPVESGSLPGRRQRSNGSLFGHVNSDSAQQARTPERRGFRLAAAAIAAGLAVFALASLYTFSANARKPQIARNEIAVQNDAKAEEPLFIPTPQAALEYKEPEPEPVTANENTQPHAEQDERAGEIDKPSAAATKEKPATQMTSEPVPSRKTQDASLEPVPAPMTRASHLPDTPLPRSTDGRVNSNLVRVRARRTATGFRYDLTFTLQEMTGRSMYLDRLSISTQAASGLRHSEVIPFSHRLGGAGVMTFTISVEMPGSSESDWRGRIVCTGIGYDDQRRVTRVAFGANVAP